MALITTKALEALRGTDDGKRLPDGGSMFGMVRATPDTKNHVSVDFQWRYKLNGKTRQVRIGSWPKMSLKALRDERDRLAVEVKSGTDPVQRKATEKLKIEVDQVEAHNKRLDRLEVIAQQGNPPEKALSGEVEISRREFLHEEVKVFGQPDHGGAQAR